MRTLAVGIAVSLFGACVQVDYEYFDFTASMTVVEEGETSLRVVRHRTMPIRYVLTKDAFELEALIDRQSTLPSVILTARGTDGEELSIGLASPQCHISESTITRQERMSRALPALAVRYEWNWANEKNCTDQSREKRTGELSISISFSEADQLQQRVPFEIRKNGVYIEFDGL